MYDIERITQEATPIGVVNYLGIKMKPSGKTIFIECPVHERETGSKERTIDNCTLGSTFKNAFYCYSCNGSGSVFDLIAGWLNLDIKKDFAEILKIAGDSCGGAELYLVPETQYYAAKKRKEKGTSVFITAEELNQLGIVSTLFPNDYISSIDESQMKSNYNLMKEINLEKYQENGLPKITYLDIKRKSANFLSLPLDVTRMIVKDKALEKMSLYKTFVLDEYLYQSPLLMGVDMNRRVSLSEELKNEFRQRYLIVENIYKKVASKEEISNINHSWLYEVYC